MTKAKLILLVLVASVLAGCQSTKQTAESLKAANQALQKATGFETVVMSVEKKQILVAATDKSFLEVSNESKETKAKELAKLALQNWTEWPISEVTVYLSHKDLDQGDAATFRFKAAELQPD